MEPTRVLVISRSGMLAAFLARELSATDFAIRHTPPGPGAVLAVRRIRPGIVVVDGIDERRDAALLEVAVVKEWCPEAEIIAVSGRSSALDAPVIEQGIFYYLVAPADAELLRVIEAAASHAVLKRR